MNEFMLNAKSLAESDLMQNLVGFLALLGIIMLLGFIGFIHIELDKVKEHKE